jgi:DNA-binding GntR family transcriptional regulator
MPKKTTKIYKKPPENLPSYDIKSYKRTFKCVTLVDQIANTLKDDILTGSLKGGDQLFEDLLKNAFGISRTPLREAFRVLEKEGLVEILPRKGTFVRRISRQDIEENFPVRATLEGLAARLAYDNLAQQDINDMEEAFECMKETARKKDFIGYSKHHISFHEVFINASGNEALITLLRNIRMNRLWQRYTYHYYKASIKNSLEFHRQILDHFKENKVSGENIEKLVRYHIEIALEPFLASMEKLEGKTFNKESI